MFHGLKLYTVHAKPGSDHTLMKPIFLREGFNLLAFLFTFLWAFYHRLWLYGFIVLACNLLIGAMVEYRYLGEIAAVIAQFGIQFVVGFTANDILRARLSKRGYIFEDITSGDSLLRAEQRYFDRLVTKA